VESLPASYKGSDLSAEKRSSIAKILTICIKIEFDLRWLPSAHSWVLGKAFIGVFWYFKPYDFPQPLDRFGRR
jgi:hypothetical protein